MMAQTQIGPSPRRVVPYAPWTQFKQFLDKIKVLNPRTIDLDYLRSNQMGGQQPGPLLATIQFLDLINESGAPTDRLESLRVRGNQQYVQALDRIIKDGYSDLFDAVNVEEADRNTIYNQIRSVYHCSPRIAETATPLFIALAHESEMNVMAPPQRGSTTTERPSRQSTQGDRRRNSGTGHESGSVGGRRRSIDSISTKSGERRKTDFDSRIASPAVHINLQIHIDASASVEQIDGIFAAMAKHLYRAEESEG